MGRGDTAGRAGSEMAPSPGPGETGVRLQKDEAYRLVKELLLERGDAQPTFSERFLARELDVGLASVRSAVERLRSEGIVASIPKMGIQLPQITHREIIEFYEMRLVLESYIVERIAGRLMKEQRDELGAVIEEQKRAAAQSDTLTYHRLDLKFHAILAELHGNGEMARALGQMRDKMYRLSRRLHRRHPERLEVNAKQHQDIADAVCDGRPEEALEAMRSHLAWGRDFTLDPDRRLGGG